jgi:hypothetical protein
MGRIVFFTVGDDECRAWPIPKGATSQEGAGEIHTDLAKGFVRAEVVGYDDFVRSGFATDVKADFRDWNVIVIYLRRYRDRQLQQAAHIDFWQRYFHEAGGKITRWAAVD